MKTDPDAKAPTTRRGRKGVAKAVVLAAFVVAAIALVRTTGAMDYLTAESLGRIGRASCRERV